VRFNPAAILAALERYEVRYVLIGGLAANAHGVRRTTRDVDVIVERSRENLERLAEAARELEVGSPVIDSRRRELDRSTPATSSVPRTSRWTPSKASSTSRTKPRAPRHSTGSPAALSSSRSSARAFPWRASTT
jgi:hypothetical protein